MKDWDSELESLALGEKMNEHEIQEKLNELNEASKPLTRDDFEEMHQRIRANRLRICMNFKNYIWAVIALCMMIGIVARVGFGIVNLVSMINSFGNPLALSGSFTGILGALVLSQIIIDLLYGTKQIGCKDLDFTPEELHELAKSENAFFAPGCFYDCRIIENIIDINTTRWYLPIVFVYSLLIYWLESPSTHVPAKSTPEGVRYAVGHMVLFGLECLTIYVLVNNMYAMWRRRSRIDTLRIDFWFDIKRYWEEQERESPGVIMQ